VPVDFLEQSSMDIEGYMFISLSVFSKRIIHLPRMDVEGSILQDKMDLGVLAFFGNGMLWD
jgi:hypothetical protein